MRRPEQVRERLEQAWRRRWPEWLGGGGQWPLAVPLDAPTEAQASARWSDFTGWIASWQSYAGAGEVRWLQRTWPRMGSQSVPTHIEFESAELIARALGPAVAADFAGAQARYRALVEGRPEAEPILRGQSAWLQALSDEDARRAARVLDWLAANPGSGLYPRQLPVEGIDTKWLERHSGPIAALLAERLGVERGTLAAVAGLAVDPPRRRLRLLDTGIRARFGGLSDISVRLDELAECETGARAALIVENQQSALACGDLEGTVVIVGGGFSVIELASIPWLHLIPVAYWGDLDVAGFQILSALRARMPHVRSCLMDEATLRTHRTLWSTDPTPPRVEALPMLSAAEAAVYAGLVNCTWGHGVRLEQERIPWAYAWSALQAMAAEKNC